MSSDVYSIIKRALESGEPVALATVARTRGSTPRKPGAKMVVRADGSIAGTIGGGCGEGEVRLKALEILQTGCSEVVQVDLTNPLDGDDKICGGVMDVFVERIG